MPSWIFSILEIFRPCWNLQYSYMNYTLYNLGDAGFIVTDSIRKSILCPTATVSAISSKNMRNAFILRNTQTYRSKIIFFEWSLFKLSFEFSQASVH